MEQSAKLAAGFNTLIRATKPQDGKKPVKRGFAIGNLTTKEGTHGVVLVTKQKGTTTGQQLAAMSGKAGRYAPLALGEIQYADNKVVLKCLKPATEAACKKAFLEYFKFYKVTPPSTVIQLLQPGQWDAVEFDDTHAESESEATEGTEDGVSLEEEPVSETTEEESESDATETQETGGPHAAARLRLETAITAGLDELKEIATNLMVQTGHDVAASPLDFTKIETLLNRHLTAFDAKVEAEGEGIVDGLLSALGTDISRLKLAMAKQSSLEGLVGAEKSAETTTWDKAITDAQANIEKLKAAIAADFSMEDPATLKLVTDNLPKLDSFLDEIKAPLPAALKKITGDDRAKKLAAIGEAKNAMKQCIAFVTSEKVKLLDANPFAVPTDLAGILGGSLRAINGKLNEQEKTLR